MSYTGQIFLDFSLCGQLCPVMAIPGLHLFEAVLLDLPMILLPVARLGKDYFDDGSDAPGVAGLIQGMSVRMFTFSNELHLIALSIS